LLCAGLVSGLVILIVGNAVSMVNVLIGNVVPSIVSVQSLYNPSAKAFNMVLYVPVVGMLANDPPAQDPP